MTQETNDKKQLMPMITTIAQQSGDTPDAAARGRGYCSDANLAAIADTTIDAYISTRKQKHGDRPGPCPRGPLPEDRDDGRLDGPEAADEDRRGRLCGTQRDRRTGDRPDQAGAGFRQFLLRGFEKVQGEWSLVCTTHNILKLYRLCV